MTKLKSTDGVRWAFMKKFDIMDRDEPTQVYLRRWRLIQTPWGALYLHRIFLRDTGAPHDHPFTFWSLILRGGYSEEVLHNVATQPQRQHYVRKRGSIHRMRLQDAHSIWEVFPGTWTLVLVGPRRRVWGFWHKVMGLPGQIQYSFKRHDLCQVVDCERPVLSLGHIHCQEHQ